MTKQLLVSSQLQAVLMTQFLLHEIKTGFWKDMRPVGHGLVWEGVEVKVTEDNLVGPTNGFKPLKNYDFLNPEFTKINEAKLVSIAQTVKPNITFKSLKKELIELARIIGGRMTDKTKEPARVYRGNNRADYDVIRVVDRQKILSVAGAKALIDSAMSTVKRTVVKKTVASTPVTEAVKAKLAAKAVKAAADEGVTIMKTAAGATVRKVAVKKTEQV